MIPSERVSAVMARVVESFTEAVVQWAEGSREESVRRSPPSLTWRRQAAGPARAAQLHDRAQVFQRAILGRRQGYRVTIAGVDWPQVDRLFEALVRALEHEAAGAWEYVGDQPDEAGLTTTGEALAVDLLLLCHVAEAPPATVEITTSSVRRNNAAASGDGSLEHGDP